MPDPTAQLMGVDANGNSGAPQPPQRDAYSELLGETGGNPVSRYFAHTAARNSGQALEAAKSRYQTQQYQLAGLQQQIEQYSGSGLPSFFSPEIEKAYKSLGGNPQLFEASKQQAVAMAARRQQLREDHQNVFGAYQDKYGGGTPPAAGAAPGATSPAGPTASTSGGDPTAQMLTPEAGTVAPASTGGLHPLHPQYDWQNHIANEPPEERQMHAELKELQQAAIQSEGLPEHADIVAQLKDSAAIYGKLLDLRLGFGQKSALQGQKDEAAMARTTSRNTQTGKASIENKNAQLQQAVDAAATGYAKGDLGSEGAAQSAVDLLNAQRRRANQHAKENGIEPVNQFFQVKKSPGITGGLLGSNYSLEPTDTDPSAKEAQPAAKGGETAAAPAAAPKTIKTNLSDLEGHVIPGPPGKPDLIIRNGEPVPYDPETNARR